MDREFKSKVGWWYHLILLILAGVTVFLFVAGTNPMLINSSGMCVMMMIFCYMSRFFKSNDAMRIGSIRN